MAASSKIKWVELIIIWFNLDKKITLHKNSATFFSYLETSFCTLSLGKDSTRFSSVVFCCLFNTIIDKYLKLQECTGVLRFWVSLNQNAKKNKLQKKSPLAPLTSIWSCEGAQCSDWWAPCLYLSQETMNPFCLLSIEIPVIISHLYFTLLRTLKPWVPCAFGNVSKSGC